MNPVARAVARDQLAKAILDQKIQLYLLEDGAECSNICTPIALVFSALVNAAVEDPKVDNDSYEIRILKGAVSACDQMIANNSYRKVNTTTLDVALDCAMELNRKVNPELFNREWNLLTGGV